MFSRSGDPLKDFDQYDREQQEWLDSLPKCCECDKPIQQESAVYIDGRYYCDDCLDEMRKDIGD